jgi:hypothetical protein
LVYEAAIFSGTHVCHSKRRDHIYQATARDIFKALKREVYGNFPSREWNTKHMPGIMPY